MNGISPRRLAKLQELLRDGRETLFYYWPEWIRTREAVLQMDNHECQHCKARGRHSAAVLVHHIRHLRDRPDLALSIWDPDTGARQLVSLCKSCHEDEHPEALRAQWTPGAPPITPERWD